MDRPARPEPSGRLFALNKPPVPPTRFVARPRLNVFLDSALDTPLTLVVAPAGSGKTVLVSGWASRRGELDSVADVRWVAVREHTKLVPAVLLAAGAPQAATRRVLAQQVDDELGAQAQAIEALRAATAAGHWPEVVVVDDAHQLPPSLMKFLSRVLTAAPESVRLLLMSRRDLPLPVVPLELSGSVQVLRAGQLRFQGDEAKELVIAHAPGATKSDIAELRDHTRGWAAALILGARALEAAEDRAAAHLLLRSTELPVLDYLLGESLDGLPRATRRLLLATCHEPEVTAHSAAVLSGIPDAAEHLASLARDGLLVTAYPDVDAPDGVVWRYHPLLLELLRRRAETSGPDRQRALDAHARAVRHYTTMGDASTALRHATLSLDPELLGSTLLELGPTLMTTGDHVILEEAIEQLSDEFRSGHPQLLGVEALMRRVLGDVNGAIRLGGEAAEALERRRAEDDWTSADAALEADIAIVNVWKARFGWTQPGIASTDGSRVLGCRHGHPEGSHSSSGELSMVRSTWLMLELAALEAWHGDLESASLHVQEALVAARSLDHQRLVVAALAQQAVLEVCEGAMQSAAGVARESLELAEGVGLVDDINISRARLALAWAAFHALDLEDAASELSRARAAPASALDPMIVTLGTVLRGMLLAEQGRIDDAVALVSGRLPVGGPLPAFPAALVAMVRAQLAAATGDASELREHSAELRNLGYAGMAGVFAAIADGYDGDLQQAMLDLEGLVEPHGNHVVRAALVVVRLTMLLRAGQAADAREELPHVLGLIAPQRLLHVLTMALRAGDLFTDLLYAEVQREHAHPFAVEALAAMRGYDRPFRSRRLPGPEPATLPGQNGHVVASQRNGSVRSEPLVALTPRESEVLQQLSLGGSYGDIARALYVTENTVKTHLTSIYRKFGVERRAEALQMARDLGLVGTPVVESN